MKYHQILKGQGTPKLLKSTALFCPMVYFFWGKYGYNLNEAKQTTTTLFPVMNWVQNVNIYKLK